MTTTIKKAPEPGPKPDFITINGVLFCQTEDGEIAIDLRLPFRKLETFMDMEEDVEAKRMPRYLLDNIIPADAKAKLEDLQDGAKTLEIVMKFAEAVGERMGASMGESKGSSDTSADTEEPSHSTSDDSE